MAKKSALGKGIASLLNNGSDQNLMAEASNKMKMNFEDFSPKPQLPPTEIHEGPLLVDINSIKVNQYQPRKIFKEKEIEELSNSIKENGLVQPLIVSKADVGFELISGERRLRALKLAKIEKAPVVIKKVTDREKLVMAIIENVQRSDLNCVEEALAYFQLMEDFKLTQDEVAKKVGKERSTVANFLRILKLPRSIIELIQNDKLTFGHAKVLASISEDKDLIITLGKEAADKGQSVRELEKLIKNNKTKKENNKESEFSPETDDLRKQIENKTGLHLDLKCRSNGSGSVILKFGSKEEFNVIYDYLMRS